MFMFPCVCARTCSQGLYSNWLWSQIVCHCFALASTRCLPAEEDRKGLAPWFVARPLSLRFLKDFEEDGCLRCEWAQGYGQLWGALPHLPRCTSSLAVWRISLLCLLEIRLEGQRFSSRSSGFRCFMASLCSSWYRSRLLGENYLLKVWVWAGTSQTNKDGFG